MFDISKHEENFKNALNLIDKSKKILLATHRNPDADGISSMLAMAHFFEKTKKSYVLFSADKVPENLSFLPKFDEITSILPDENNFDLLIGFDYGKFDRLSIENIINNNKDIKIISFDHHPFIHQKGDINIIDTSFSSTTHILYTFLKFNNIEIDKNMGLSLLSGLFTDTSELKNSNATIFAMEMFKEILKFGKADYRLIVDNFLKKKRHAILRAAGLCLARAEKDKETDMIVSFFTEKDADNLGISFGDIDDIPDILNESSEGRMVAFIRENKSGRIDISLRSDEMKGVDVSKIALEMGGGGHKYASGAKLDGNLEDIFGILRNVVKRYV